MTLLSPSAIIDLWERGNPLHPIDRALAILTSVHPEHSWHELASLTVGKRDAALLGLRQTLFGDRLQGRADCPSCREEVEFELSVGGLLESAPESNREGGHFPIDGLPDFRLPDSFDLAAVADATDDAEALRRLAERCLIGNRDEASDKQTLDDETIGAISQAMEERDPLADIRLSIVCPGCSTAWKATLDILSWLWQELSGEAERLLGEVHLLARAYGWSEESIISMSSRRRNLYVEMIL